MSEKEAAGAAIHTGPLSWEAATQYASSPEDADVDDKPDEPEDDQDGPEAGEEGEQEDSEESEDADNDSDDEDEDSEADEKDKRIREQEKGVAKLKDRLEKQGQELDTLKSERDRLKSFADQFVPIVADLNDPIKHIDATKWVLEQAAEVHNKTVEELIAEVTGQQPETEWESEGEMRLAAQVKALEARLRAVDPETKETLEYVKTKREQEQRDAEINRKVDESYKAVRGTIRQEYDGFEVSRDDVKAAIAEFPGLAPVKAVEAHYARRLAKHMAGQASKRGPKAPTIPDSVERKGSAVLEHKGGKLSFDKAMQFVASHKG